MTPRSGFPQQLKVVMKKSASKAKALAETIEPLEGCALRLIRPGTYTMGSSRRQQGRRSNETLRTIALKRPFYMGTTEVTNKQFRAFLAGHDSGLFKGQALSRDDQPVVRVAWEQAALFCNWLSARESLSPVYVKKGDRLEAAEVLGTGYRLPTEAEWEYCARSQAKGTLEKYPWGESFPPEEKAVNIADVSARGLLSHYLEAYNDGYPVSAPVGSLKPNGLGIHDLGGNVAEWCHDFYSIYSYKPEAVYQDPLGPREGKHRVVRGSSWKHAGISALRVAYRDYSSGNREDLGFRICRYAEEGDGQKQ
jgi:formylglycine-generating enzyme required for sulfatase activity